MQNYYRYINLRDKIHVYVDCVDVRIIHVKMRLIYVDMQHDYYRPPGGGRLFDMKVVSSYVFLRTYYV